MALYPTVNDIKYSNGISVQMDQKMLISNYDNLNVEKRKLKSLYPTRNVQLSYKNITSANKATIEQFAYNRKGMYETFTFTFNHISTSYDVEYIGTGDDSTVTFNCPCHTTSELKIYLSSSGEQTLDSDYTLSAGGGLDGMDSITFAVAPDAGDRITCDFTGILAIRCRFAEMPTFSTAKYGSINYHSGSVSLVGRLITE